MNAKSTYEKYVSALSIETQGCLREHLENKYQRGDFDLLDWADHYEISEFVFDGFLGGEPTLAQWGKTIELAAVNMLEAYLNDDIYTKTTLGLVIKRLRRFQREEMEGRSEN